MNDTSAVSDLIAYARVWDFDAVEASPGKARHMIHTLADRLEAAEAELTRRDTVIANAESWFACYSIDIDDVRARHELETILDAAPVSLEAVKAETTGGMHSDSCYPFGHEHGEACEYDCPTCHAQPVATEGAS